MARTRSAGKEVTPLPVRTRVGRPRLPRRVVTAERRDECQEERSEEHKDIKGASVQNEEIHRLSAGRGRLNRM